MSEEEFDKIADIFRDPRVWWKDKQGNWVKVDIWDSQEENKRKEEERKAYWNEHKQDLTNREAEREKLWRDYKNRVK